MRRRSTSLTLRSVARMRSVRLFRWSWKVPRRDRPQMGVNPRHSPDLVGTVDRHPAQQVRVDLVPWGGRSGQVVDAAAADPKRLGLLGDRQIMGAVDQRCALSRPALLSAPDQKSLVSVSSPILACNVFTSTAGAADFGSDPNTPAAPSRS